MGDPSIILGCLVFFLYPIVCGEWNIFLLAAACQLGGAAAELFFICVLKKPRWVPILLCGVMAVLEILYQLCRFGILHIMDGHAIWGYVIFGVAVLHVLSGALIGWGLYKLIKKETLK